MADIAYVTDRTGYEYYPKNIKLVRPLHEYRCYTILDLSPIFAEKSTPWVSFQAEILYSRRADPGLDYFPVTDSYIIMGDGSMQGSIPITIKADGIPELPELFRIKLTRVELLEGPPANPSNMPQVRVKMNEYRQNECI